jgi:chorismate mutase/GNAT superfamily N-acetyltransferase
MSAEEISLRPADESDGEAVAAIHLAARREAPMPPGVHTDDEVRFWLAGRLQTDEVWLAEVGGRAAGYARMSARWLDDLYVAPPYAGQGVGSLLLDTVKARRPAGFCLWVFETNAPARAFYARRGLVELERTDGSGNEEHAPDVRMAWPGDDPVAFFRGLIDEVDDSLGELLARRAALTRAVQGAKADASRDAVREQQIADRLARVAPELGADRVARIMDAIITESLDASEEPGRSP